MSPKRKAKPVKAEAIEYDDQLDARLSAIEENLAKLMDALFVPAPELKKKGVKRHVLPSNPASAKRARIARAANYHGIPVDEWVRLHGERDRRFPPDEDPTKPSERRRK